MRIRPLVAIVALTSSMSLVGVEARANPQYFSDTGHYYEVIQERLDWDAAQLAAASQTFRGATGHLATIGSLSENAFITNMLPVTPTWDERFALGGYQPAGSPEPGGNWQWITNEPWNYTNWRTGEPSNRGAENYLEIYTHPVVRGTWNDITNTELQYGYVIEYENAALLPQICYLDFSGYTAPAGYGAAEQIAAQVKASVAAKYSQQDLTFMTSFDGSSPNPNITSIIHVGGTNSSATVLGSAAYDPGNSNRSDAGYVYSDQAIFGSLPTDSTEYKNMLANTTAHEVGHLLGYSHADAAGMPFMASGGNMQNRLLEDLISGKLGECTQEKLAYILDTDVDLEQAQLACSIVRKYQTVQAFRTIVEEYGDYYDVDWQDVADVADGANYVLNVVGSLAQLLPQVGQVTGPPLIYISCSSGQGSPLIPQWEKDSMRLTFCPEPDGLLDLDELSVTLQPVWNEAQQAYVLQIDQAFLSAFADGFLNVSFVSGRDEFTTVEFTLVDADSSVLGTTFVAVGTIPEPAALGLLTVGGVALLRRRRR